MPQFMNWTVLVFYFVLPSISLLLIVLWVENGRRRKHAKNIIQAQIKTIRRFQLANKSITTSLDSSTLLPQVAEQMCNALRVTSAYICEFDVDSSRSTVVAEYISPYASAVERISDMGATYIEDDEVYIADFKGGRPSFSHITDSDLADDERAHMMEYDAKSIMYIPMQIRGARNNHVELWESRHHREFSDVDIVLAQSIAQQAAIALDNARLYEQTQTEVERRRQAEADIRIKATELAVLVDVADALSVAQTMDAMMLAILEQSVALIGADMGALFIAESKTDEFVVGCTYPEMPSMIGERQALRERGFAGHVGQTRQTEIVQEMMHHPLAPNDPPTMRYCVILPIQTETDLIGALRVGFSNPHTFEKEEIEVLTAVTNIAANALRRIRLMTTLEQRVDDRTRDLANANSRLKEMDRLKSKFISDMSHELRTPITNLQLYTDLMIHGKAEKQGHYMDIIREQTMRLATLSGSILTMSRLDDHRLTLDLEPTNLNTIAQEAIARYETKAAVRELELQLKSAEKPPFVLADTDYLPRIVNHLMDNALNYTTTGSITIKTDEDDDGNGRFTICDSGRGIDPVDLPHLFERFYRGQQIGTSNIPGSGLGMSIVKDLVELHNGRVEVKSTPNVCTCVTIYIPLVGKIETEVETGE